MKIFKLLSVIFFSMIFSSLSGKEKPVFSENNLITIKSESSVYRIELCTPSMFRVRMANNGVFEENEPWMVIKYDWSPVEYTLKGGKNTYTVQTSAIKITFNINPFSVQVYDLKNNQIHGDAVSQKPSLGNMNDSVFSRKKLFPDEHFFGFGERMDFIDQRGKEVFLNVGRGNLRPHEIGAYNILEANYSPVPFMMSTRGYGIFFHNAYPSKWDMGKTSDDTYSFSAPGGEMDYYFIFGPAFTSLLEQYTQLTGRSPLLPRFSSGLHVGTYSGGTWGHEHLTSQYYVVALAKKFRELGIPLDILHLDSTWRIFGKKNGKGGTSFDWRQPGFPDPSAMFDSLYALNIQMAGLHIRPRIDDGDTKNLLEQAQKIEGITYPENGKPGDFINYFDSTSSQWWWDNCLLPLAKQGCMFVKTDEGSAFGHIGNEINKVGPQGKDIAKWHNLFPIAYAQRPYEHFASYNKLRGMNHTREGFAGIQRYPFIFAGDWPTEWQYFLPVIRAGINLGLSGVGSWTHCMGGFEHNGDPELYVRWCQFGMFSPVAMLFGMDHPGYKEPWNYGEEALKIFTKYDKLRYTLTPYIYTTFYQMYRTGIPVMRAMVLINPEDENTYTIDDQYFFGDNFLVCPVTVKSAKTRVVYLPEGKWIDYYTGKKYDGKQNITVTTPLDRMPLFVKAGAIIPMQNEVQYLGKTNPDTIIFEVFPYKQSQFELYEDDGLSEEYKNGMYSLTKVTCNDLQNDLIVEVKKPEGKFKVEKFNTVLKMHLDKKPASIQNIDPSAWRYDEENKILWISLLREKDTQLIIKK